MAKGKKYKSITKLRKKAWKVFSKYIRRKEKECFTCGVIKDWREMHAGHFIHKDCLDFDERNVHAQCKRCNCFLSGNLINYAIKLEKVYGQGIIQELKRQGDKIKKWKVAELEEIIEKYI